MIPNPAGAESRCLYRSRIADVWQCLCRQNSWFLTNSAVIQSPASAQDLVSNEAIPSTQWGNGQERGKGGKKKNLEISC